MPRFSIAFDYLFIAGCCQSCDGPASQVLSTSLAAV